jgi:hypothetical protein
LRGGDAAVLRLRGEKALQAPLRHVEQEDQSPIQDRGSNLLRMRSI